MKPTTIVLSIVGLASVGISAVAILSTQPQQELTEPVVPPPQSLFEHTVAAVGIIEPNSESIAIGSPFPGVVASVLVAAGERVEANQALYVLDHRHLDAQRSVALARVEQAERQVTVIQKLLDQARRRALTSRRLANTGTIASEDRDDRVSELEKLEAELDSALASVRLNRAEVASVETEIDRSTIRAPKDGTILQTRMRPGEFLDASGSGEPRLLLGCTDPLHVRADVDEFDIPRLAAGARATATPRGNANERFDLQFVRFEPLVVPKRSLTGDPGERVDTRVLQVIYQVVAPTKTLFVGQQMDLLVEGHPRSAHSASLSEISIK